MAAGELAIVLHTHMPYVEGGGRWPPESTASYLRHPEGFGTWPFGEEWLWEAIATCYLPLLELLERRDAASLTLSLTPVLADQLEMPGALERCLTFLREIRPESHRRDVAELEREGAPAALVGELRRSAAEYAAAAERLADLGPHLLARLGSHAGWTSSATHAVLPLLATSAGVDLQLQTGIASHRRRFGGWAGGFWLPECAHAPWLGSALEQAGVRATCVELTGLLGLGDPRHLRPLASAEGPLLWPIDRATIDLVWGEDGYPSGAAYRDYHRYTTHRHRVWRIDGTPYDHGAALRQVRADAADFVARVGTRIADGGLCVFALDTELLGHWWYEGVAWLEAVLDQAARQGLALTTLDDARHRYPPAPAPSAEELGVTSWGEGGDLRTWSGPAVAPLAWLARRHELQLVARVGAGAARSGGWAASASASASASTSASARTRARRELLALQSSDWAFLAHRRLAGDYPEQRARWHAAALEEALANPAGVDAALRGLAPDLVG